MGEEEENKEENVDGNKKTEDETAREDKNHAIDGDLGGVESYFEKNSFEVGEKIPIKYGIPDATDAFSIRLNGEPVELYLYEADNDNLNSIQENGYGETSGLKFPAIANGNIVIVNLDIHPEQDKLEEVFNSY